MDPTSLVVGVAVTVAIVVVLMVIAKFGFGGESDYEQTIARQKEALLDDVKSKTSDKKKIKAEKKKKPTNKVKSEAAATSASDLDGETTQEESAHTDNELAHPHVEYDPDPVVIEASKSAKPTNPSKASKAKPAKSILHNKDEAPLVNTKAVVQETVYADNAPKDALSLKHDKGKKGKKDKNKTSQSIEPKPVVDEVIVASVVSTQAAEPPKPKQLVVEETVAPVKVSSTSTAPTKKSKPSKANKAEDTLMSIMETIQESVLTKDELQTLVESILAKQSEDSWTTKTTKPDPLALLRKQLEDAQESLAAEQANVISAQLKVKEMTSKLQTSERASSSAATQINELQRRMQESHDSHKKELKEIQNRGYLDTQKVQQQQEQINQLVDENSRLKKSVADTEHVTQMQSQLKALQTENQQAAANLTETQRVKADLENELHRLKDTVKQLDGDKNELKNKYDESSQRLQSVSADHQQAVTKAAETEKNYKNLQDQLRSLQADKDRQVQELAKELKLVKDSIQQTPATNGSHDENNKKGTNGISVDITELEKKVDDLQSALSAKDDQLTNLNKQLGAARNSQKEIDSLQVKLTEETNKCKNLDKQIANLNADVKKLTDKNNDLIRKNWLLNDALEAAESASITIQDDLKAKNSSTQQLKESFVKLQAENNELTKQCESLAGGQGDVSKLTKQLETVQSDITSKDSTIKQLNDSLKQESAKLAQLNKDKSTEANKLQAQLDKLNQEISTLRSDNKNLNSRVRELSQQSSEDSSSDSVNKYKNALVETDTMLTELSAKVDVEYKGWKTQLDDKDREISTTKQKLEVALKELNDTRNIAQMLENASARADTEADRAKQLSSQLEETNKKLEALQNDMELQKTKATELTSELTRVDNSLKDEQLKNRQLAQHLAAAMAASGDADDSGTCV